MKKMHLMHTFKNYSNDNYSFDNFLFHVLLVILTLEDV